MRKCPNCGMDNKPSANFCGRCGSRMPEVPPAETLKPESGASTVQPAPKVSARKWKSWKMAAALAIVLMAGVRLSKGIGRLHSCPSCDGILGLQEELQAVLAENEDNSLTFDDYNRWNIKVTTLSNEIQLLKDHECNMPIRQVEGQPYAYGRYEGSYTGDWKSTAPYGEGVFSGSYREGDTQYVLTYSGEWAGGAPDGTGAMMKHREYLGAGSQENWKSWLYEGAFVNGALTGSGWSGTESSTGDRFEYFDGVYRDGFLQGQANFLQYRDGELYDKGIAEGIHYAPVYSERQEVLNAVETAGAILVAGVAAKCLFDVIDLSISGTNSKSFQNSSAGKWLEEQRASIAADEEMWRRNKEKEESSKQLYDTWQALEGRAKWCETSEYYDVQDDADYFRSQADEARKAYDASR